MYEIQTITYDQAGNIIERSVCTKPKPAASVEIATDGNGNPKPLIKVYDEDPQEAKRLACKLYRQIMKELLD